MKIFLQIVVALLAISLLFSSCGLLEEHQFSLAVCGSYSVPGMFCYELKGGTYTCNVLEQDAQGRTLYEYTTTSIITQKETTALVICQKHDEQYVYFYEDICYIFKGDTDLNISLLKERNDWGKELDESKMSRRENRIALEPSIVVPLELAHQKVEKACCEALEIQSSQIRVLCIMDVDPAGRGQYWLVFEENGSEISYVVIADADYRVALLPANGNTPKADELAMFKKKSGWVYGFAI